MSRDLRRGVMLGICFVVLAYAAGVVVLGVAYRSHASTSNLRTWLAGTLTPGLLFAAVLSFWTAEKARHEQAAAQHKMAEITERATFAAQREPFQRHLSYLGSCVLMGDRMSMKEHTALLQQGFGGYEKLWLTLVRVRNKEANPNELATLADLGKDDRNFFLGEFQESLLETLRLGYAAGLYSHLDRRVKELPALFSFHDLWRIQPHKFLAEYRPPFSDFFNEKIDV